MRIRGFGAAVAVWLAVTLPAGAVQLDKIKLPDGFSIAVWADVPAARSMALGDGFVIVGTMGEGGNLYAIPFDKETMEPGPVKTIGQGLNSANGPALLDGVLYLAEQHRITRWGDAPFDIDAPVPEPVKIGPDLIDNPWHGWRYMVAGADKRLYVAIGTPCNVCMPEGLAGTVISMDGDGNDVRTVASGIRNSVGLAFHPGNGDLYFTDNGADMMGDNVPPEELNRVTQHGQSFGYPWFGGGRAKTKEFRDDSPPEGVQFPVAEFQAHTAGLGLEFYGGDMFPAEYRGDLFLAQHGSWNRTFPVGYRLMRVRLDETGNVKGKEVFASGWLRRGRDWGRPVDVKQLPDGSLLMTDDKAGVIYRITYGE